MRYCFCNSSVVVIFKSTYVSAVRTVTGAKTLEVATRDAPIDLLGAKVKADAVAAMKRTARENFMVVIRRNVPLFLALK
jgi:hypothetical protein